MSTEVAAPADGVDDPGALVVQIADQRVSDVEVAAVGVAVVALLGTAGNGAAPPPDPAWRRAGLWEASTARRVRSPADLRRAEAP